MANVHNSLAHTKWMCKYHIVFVPKYRRKIIYNQIRKDISNYISTLCKYKGVQIVEGHMMPDHVHLILSIPPKISVSSFMGYLKGKSSLMIFENHANMKYKFGNRKFSCGRLLCFYSRFKWSHSNKICPRPRKDGYSLG